MKRSSAPCRVCQIISGDVWGGAEALVSGLLEEFHKRDDFDHRVILFNEGRLSSKLKELGIPVIVFKESENSFFTLVSHIAGAIRDIAPAIIHAHGYKENIVAYLASRFGEKRVLVSTVHGYPEIFREETVRRRLVEAVNQMLLKRAFHMVVTVSDEMRERLLKSKRTFSSRTVAIHNALKLPQFDGLEDVSPTLCIGSAGRLKPVKDFEKFIKLAARINKIRKDVTFMLAGDGPDRASLEEFARNEGIQHILRFWGEVQDMSTFYRSISIFVNTSLMEGLSLAILEAMAFGVPVVVFDVGGCKEIIDDGVDGFLVKNRSEAQLVERCLELLCDYELRKRIAIAARRKVASSFSMEVTAKHYYMLYRSFIKDCKKMS